MSILGALDSIGGAGGVSASSSASATGGTIGAFNFAPKAVPTWLLVAGVVLLVVLALPHLRR